jgi:hypothetical protein
MGTKFVIDRLSFYEIRYHEVGKIREVIILIYKTELRA